MTLEGSTVTQGPEAKEVGSADRKEPADRLKLADWPEKADSDEPDAWARQADLTSMAGWADSVGKAGLTDLAGPALLAEHTVWVDLPDWDEPAP